MKKLIVPIVNRTNYTKLKPVLLRLRENRGLDVSLVLSSGIVISRITDSAKEIYSDGMNVAAEIDCLMMNDSLESMTKSLGVSIIDHGTLLKKEKPDAMLVVGDRYDMLAPVLSAKMANIPIMHIQGGERSGSIDDTIRDIVSICSSRHYVSTEKAYKNVASLVGEGGIRNVGCPAVEFMASFPQKEYLDVNNFKKHFKDEFSIEKNEPYLLIIVHPDTTNPDDIDMEIVLQSALSFKMKCIVLYPNIDAFNSNILQKIRYHHNQMICLKHAPPEDFAQLLYHAKCLIGNSSAGIREAASFKTPVVNIGERQIHREQNYNTYNTNCKYKNIVCCIERAMICKPTGENIYYKENSSQMICEDIVGFMKV